jgi:MYND finger
MNLPKISHLFTRPVASIPNTHPQTPFLEAFYSFPPVLCIEAMAMRIEDVLHEHKELMTPEELEDYEHDPSTNTMFDPIPRWFLNKTMDAPTPDEFDRARFETRPPAFGLTLSEIDQLEQHVQNPNMTEGDKRRFFHHLRETMCLTLISPCDCSTLSDLFHILRAEVESGVPAPVPEWYTFSEMRYGPRRLGYRKCDSRGCLKTETRLGSRFPQCSRCQLAAYCGKECQTADWKIRHKSLCRTAKAEKDMTQRTSAWLEALARQHE